MFTVGRLGLSKIADIMSQNVHRKKPVVKEDQGICRVDVSLPCLLAIPKATYVTNEKASVRQALVSLPLSNYKVALDEIEQCCLQHPTDAG